MTDKIKQKETLLFLFAILAGIILRLILRSHTSLWEDEIIAVTHATQPFGQVIVDCIVNDIHPPLYFLQLHVWSLLGRSDAWLIANSILFSLIAIASLYDVSRRLDGRQAGLAAAAVLAVLPAAIWLGEEVRMYAWLSVLLIWLYYYIQRAFAMPGRAWPDCVMIVVLAIAIVYTHAIGFLAISFYGLYAASWLVTRRASRRDWAVWALLFASIGLASLPMIVSAVLHPADMHPLTDIGDVGEWTASTITGPAADFNLGLRFVGVVVFGLTITAGARTEKARRITLCFLVAPIVLCIATGIAFRPLFKTNFFSTLLSPFLAIVIADLLLCIPPKKAKSRITLTAFILSALIAIAIVNRVGLDPRTSYFSEAAAVIKQNEQQGDIVWAPQSSIFQGMAWYLAGPDWGSPLKVRAPIRPQSHWWKLITWLGPVLANKLHLIPTSQSVMTENGLPLYLGVSSQPQFASGKRIWLVTSPRSDLSKNFPGLLLAPLQLEKSLSYPPLVINLYE